MLVKNSAVREKVSCTGRMRGTVLGPNFETLHFYVAKFQNEMPDLNYLELSCSFLISKCNVPQGKAKRVSQRKYRLKFTGVVNMSNEFYFAELVHNLVVG